MKKVIARVTDDKKILKEALKTRGVTQKALAEKIGMLPSSMSMNMTRDRMGLDMFKRILNGLEYDVAVVDRESGRILWIVAQEKDSE